MIDLTDYPTPWKAELDTNDTGKWWRVSAVNGMRITGDLPRDIAHLIAASPELFVAYGTAIAVFNGVDAGLGKKVIANTKAYETILLATARARGEVK